MRELKIGDRVVDWTGEAGVVLTVNGDDFVIRYEDGTEMDFGWVEFNPADQSDLDNPIGTFRFEDTEYPEWPR